MWRYRICYMIAVFAATGLFIWTNERQILLLLLLLCVFPIMSGLVTGIWMRTLQFRMIIPERCVTGQETYIHLHIRKRAGWLSRQIVLPVTMINHMFDRKKEQEVIMFPGYRKEEEFLVPVSTEICGRVSIRIESLYCYDVFRLFRIRKPYRIEKVLMIYPSSVPIRVILGKRPKSKETGDVFDEYIRGNDTSETLDLRNYQKGDSIRAIHWKLSSKMDKLLVREFSRPSNFDTIVLFSLSGRNRIPDRVISRVASIVLSVSDALLKLDMEHQVGCMIHGKMVEIPVRSRNDSAEVLGTIMGMKATEKTSDIIETFIKTEGQYQYTKVIFVTAEIDEKVLRTLAVSVSLSVILTVEGEEDSMDDSGGYDVLALSREETENDRYISI